MCDRLPIFEETLAKAIRDAADCAPSTGKEGNINYVLTVDFTRRTMTVYPGKSGEWRGPLAKKAATCVEKALEKPRWETIRHKYRFYLISMLATYASPGA